MKGELITKNNDPHKHRFSTQLKSNINIQNDARLIFQFSKSIKGNINCLVNICNKEDVNIMNDFSKDYNQNNYKHDYCLLYNRQEKLYINRTIKLDDTYIHNMYYIGNRINDLFSILPQKSLLLYMIFKTNTHENANDIFNLINKLLLECIFICDKCHISLSSNKNNNLIDKLHRCQQWSGCESTFFCVNCYICKEKEEYIQLNDDFK